MLKSLLSLLPSLVRVVEMATLFFLGKNTEKNKVLKRDIKDAKKDAKAWANRPYRGNDVVVRLRDRAKKSKHDT